MHTFLQFVFNADGLREHMRELWMEYFDYAYLDEKIIGGVEKNLPMVSDILRNLEKKATGKVTSALGFGTRSERESDTLSHGLSNQQSIVQLEETEQQPKKVTMPQPFNLTKPKPKVIPPPESIDRVVKANPVPSGMFKKNLDKIEKEKEDRRKDANE
jgi:hypothetical protein